MENKPNRIIWHHSAVLSNGHQANGINNGHKTRGFPKSLSGFYGGYHVLIEKDGTIVRFRADNEIGAHDADENINSLGVCLAGNFSIEQPTPQQVAALTPLLREWCQKYNISPERIDPHRRGDTTECPGKLLPDNWARDLVRAPGESDLLSKATAHLEEALILIRAAH